MESPTKELLERIISQLNDCLREQSQGMDVLASLYWDNALELIRDWTDNDHETMLVVTGIEKSGNRRIIFSECTIEEAKHFIESLPPYIEPRIESVIAR